MLFLIYNTVMGRKSVNTKLYRLMYFLLINNWVHAKKDFWLLFFLLSTTYIKKTKQTSIRKK